MICVMLHHEERGSALPTPSLWLPTCTGATIELLRQSLKVSALVDPRMPARPAQMLVIRITSWERLARLRRPWEQRVREAR